MCVYVCKEFHTGFLGGIMGGGGGGGGELEACSQNFFLKK